MLPEGISGTFHPIPRFIFCDRFSPTYCTLLAAITSNDEPKHFSQAIINTKWRDAVAAKIFWLLKIMRLGSLVLLLSKKRVYKKKYHKTMDVQ